LVGGRDGSVVLAESFVLRVNRANLVDEPLPNGLGKAGDVDPQVGGMSFEYVKAGAR
jgi:hypothetical protein